MFPEIDKILPFIVFIISYSFGTYLFLREPNLVINRLFIIIMLAPFLDDLINLVYWLDIAGAGFFSGTRDFSMWLLPPLYYHFIESFEERKISWPKFFGLYSVCAIFWAAYLQTSSTNLQYFYLAVSLIWLLTKYYKAFLQIRRFHRFYQKIQYFFIYTGFTLNLILIFLLDFFFSTGYNQFEMLSPLIVVSFIATALLKVRFANIFYILKKSTIYAIFLFIFIFSYIAAAAYLFNFFQIINNIYATYYMAIFFVIFAIIFRPIVDFIRNFIDQHIFKTAFNYKMIVESFSQKISNFVEFTDVITAISTLFNETFKPAAIYFQGIAEKPAFALDDLDEVKKYLIKIFESASPSSIIDPIFVEYLSPETISEQSYDFFLKSGISIIIPVYQQDSLFGFYFLGNKFMKDAYNDDDIQLINTILNQAKVALNNAGMYKNLVEANKRLEETIIKLENTQLELAKKEKFAALGRLSANIAHEVKNPLGIMKISASSLSDALSEKPKLKEVANFINKEIDKLNNFVSELLDFARDREIQSVPSDISNLLNELVERGNLYAKSEGKNVAIILSMPASKITVMADPDQLSRALLNIVINAIDSISKEKEGKIEIGLSEKKDQTVEITITDNGCGIDESQIKKGIEPFFTTKKKGTGLGLVVTQQIVEKHGGKLAISSKINEGTKLGVYLPKKTA